VARIDEASNLVIFVNTVWKLVLSQMA